MKRSLLLAVLGFVTVVSTVTTYGQGQINFKNYFNNSSPIVTYGNGANAGLGVGPEIKAQLGYFIGVTSDPSQLIPLTFANGGSMSPVAFGLGAATGPDVLGTGAGWFDGGTVFIPGAAGNTVTFAIFAFSGSSYASSLATAGQFAGMSALFSGTVQPDATSGVPDFTQGAWQSFSVVTSVPEPATIALAGLGLASLALIRRRK